MLSDGDQQALPSREPQARSFSVPRLGERFFPFSSMGPFRGEMRKMKGWALVIRAALTDGRLASVLEEYNVRNVGE